MGLYAEIDIIDGWGFPFDLTGGDDEIGYESVEVDYSYACQVFVSTFIRVATKLVPVDTGYLRSTINADTDGFSFCCAEATADYPQYVEYGTWCMDAQPYFEIALAEACAAAGLEAQAAVDVAQEILEGLLQGLMDAAMEASGVGSGGIGESFGGFLGGQALFIGLAFLSFPIMVNLYAIMDSLFNPLMGGRSFAHGDVFIPEVIIT